MYSISLSPTARVGRFASAVIARFATLVAVVICAQGCSLFSGTLERAAKGAGKVVTYYCENVTIPEIREQVRAAVNQHAAPHSVAVECVDGGPVLRSGSGEAISAPQPGEAAPSPEAPQARAPIVIIGRDGKPKPTALIARTPIIIISKDGKPKPKPVAA